MKCQCGCGEDAGVYARDNKRLEQIAGTPKAFLRGHNSKSRPGRKCSLEECNKPHWAKDFCYEHYQRNRRNGDPRRVVRKRSSVPLPTKQGYMRRFMPEHPNSNSNGYVYEHALVMSGILGRPLRTGEQVHHKNGIRHDNDPDNLELWIKSHPSGIRASDAVAWAREILARYDTVELVG